jgi:hypothetical protein
MTEQQLHDTLRSAAFSRTENNYLSENFTKKRDLEKFRLMDGGTFLE